jgi:hypothetical protein
MPAVQSPKDDLIVQAVKRGYNDMSEDIADRIAANDDPLETLVVIFRSNYEKVPLRYPVGPRSGSHRDIVMSTATR